MQMTIEWHKARDGRPEKSGMYLCYTRAGSIADLPYSSVHERFNAFDSSKADLLKGTEIDVLAWAEKPDMAAFEEA